MARPLRLTARFWTKLEPELLASLDSWCTAAGMKRAEVVRLAIGLLLKIKPPRRSNQKAAAAAMLAGYLTPEPGIARNRTKSAPRNQIVSKP